MVSYGMKVYVECESLRLSLKQTVGALSGSGARRLLTLTVDYNKDMFRVDVSLFTDDETIMPNASINSTTPICYITDDSSLILSSEVLPAESVSVEVEDIGSFFKWMNKRPKGYEYFSIAISESYVYLEQCDMNRSYSGELIMERSAGDMKTPCKLCCIPTDMGDVEYMDSVDGKVFLDTVETLYVVISDLPSIESPARYLYFLNGKAKAYADRIRIAYEGATGLENELILEAEYADYVSRMGKECYAKFLKDSDVNYFNVKIAVINPDRQAITFVGVNNTMERIYGNIIFDKTELANIEYHEVVTGTDNRFAANKPHNVFIEKETLLQAIKDAEALNVKNVDFEIDGSFVAMKSRLGKTEVSANCSHVECGVKSKFSLNIKSLKKLAKTQFDTITINFNADEQVSKRPVRASYDSNDFVALCQTI